jgi:phage gpG-like protein
MPGRPRQLTNRPAPRLSGLRLDEDINAFSFKPSLGILARDIEKFGLDIRSFRQPLVRAIKQVMIPSFRQNFAEEGRPSWEPMSEATEMIRDREGSSGPLLDRSGKLKQVAQQQNIWTVTKESASIRDLPPKVWYGKLHQAGYGGMAQRVKAEMKKGGSFSEAAKRATRKLDKEILSGGARSHVAADIPQREFIMFQEEDMDGVFEVFQRWLEERAIGAGWVFST